MGSRAWWLIVLGACSSAPPEAGSSAAAAAAPSSPRDASACRDGDEAAQRHGTPCLCCHSDEFGIGGSIDPAGGSVARIVVTDARGDVADLSPNSYLNFFRHFTMTPPLRAVAYSPDGRAVAMRAASPSGDCNGCHFEGGPIAPIRGP